MHQIEEILKQLNQQSAEIQPGTVQLLTRIQQRLMDRTQEPVSASIDAQAELPQRVPPVVEEDLQLEHELPPVTLHAQERETRPAAEEELTPLLRSIMDSNRRLRGDLEPSLHQPRFMAVDRSLETVQANVESAATADGSWSSMPSAPEGPLATAILPNSETTHEGFDQTEHPRQMGSNVLDGGDVSGDAGPSVSIRFPSQELTKTETLTPAPSETKPPPVPHFESRPVREANSLPQSPATPIREETVDANKLPIFDSVWFRRNAPTREIGQIVDQIQLKVPPVAPAILQITQSIESQAQGHLVATQIAWELSRRAQGDVLLVDGDFLMKEISRQLENVYLPGLADIMNLGESMSAVVRKTGVDHLFWLPSGQSDVSFRKTTPEQWSRFSAELKRRFAYVCVYSGAAEEKVATTWGRFCDFTFLLTCLADDLGQPTQDLVDHLRRADSRVAGLISIE